MNFADHKARSRQRVHDTFAVPGVLTNDDGSFNLTARLHGKMVIGGDLEGQGYATIVEGVFRVLFSRTELATLGVVPVRGDRVTLPDYFGAGYNAVIELDARDEYDGPVTEKWSVTAT